MKLIVEINGKQRSLDRIVAAILSIIVMAAVIELFLEGMDREYELRDAATAQFLQGTKFDPNR
jgi:hypothetical protein